MSAEHDWSQGFDDYGPEYWEDVFGGPDDDQLENRYVLSGEESEDRYEWATANDDHVDESYPIQQEGRIDASVNARQAEIVQWLLNSPLAHVLERDDYGDSDDGKSRIVPLGALVRLADGVEFDVLDWLEQEGFEEGTVAGGYVCSHYWEGRQLYGMVFRRLVVTAPFVSLKSLRSKGDRGEFSF